MANTLDSIIRQAMDQRKTLSLEYKGQKERRYHQREFEPWCYGIHKDTGNHFVRAYQVAGHTESGRSENMPFWRQARLDRMRNVEITNNDIRSESPEYYDPQDGHMREVFKALPE